MDDKRIYLFDSTLRDGAQTQGVDFRRAACRSWPRRSGDRHSVEREQAVLQESLKPRIICPNCQDSFEANELASKRLYRTKHGIDVFQCPHCGQNLKIEPREYLFVKSQIESGAVPEGAGILGFVENELTPSEKLAKSERRGILGRLVRR